MLASALKKRNPRKPVALAVPTLEPTELLVAFTGSVSEQLESIAVARTKAANILIFFIKKEVKGFSYSIGFSDFASHFRVVIPI
jgi:hypothetical protein